jgi:hypothetical protein
LAELAKWLSAHSTAVSVWAGALCIFGIYTVLYKENKCYRLFEHVFIGLYAGYTVYVTWAQVLKPKWWDPMTAEGQWFLIFDAIVGSMFYFIYSRRHAWISRVVFGLFMGFSAGGIFREYYELYFPQMGSSMKSLSGSFGNVASVVVFYVIFIAAMSYFFFSFEHKHPAVTATAKAGRWFLMIGFGAMFGSTVMGRMTLFIGRLNYLINKWWPVVYEEAHYTAFYVVMGVLLTCIATGVALYLVLRQPKPVTKSEE